MQATDGRQHNVEVYFDASAGIAVNEARQQVAHAQKHVADLEVLELGSVDQPILGKRGDDMRIDWGHFYVAAPKSMASLELTVPRDSLRATFAQSGVSASLDILTPDTAAADTLVSEEGSARSDAPYQCVRAGY